MDNMGATVKNIPSLEASVISTGGLLANISSKSSLFADIVIGKTLVGTATITHLMSAKVGLNILSYDDPIDYLLNESGVILRTEDDKYIKLETSI